MTADIFEFEKPNYYLLEMWMSLLSQLKSLLM